MTRFNHFSISELETLRKVIIASIKQHQFQGIELGQLKRLWAELDAELQDKRINSYFNRRNRMTWEEAIKFCEEHECEDCPAFIEDKRTDYQTKVLHYHCCWNLVDEEKKDDKNDKTGC